MKGIITGFEPMDYVSKKTGKPVQGCNIYFSCKSSSVFGEVGKSEYFGAETPIYKRAIAPLLEQFYEENSAVYGATIDIDYNVTKRNGQTFYDVADVIITPKQSKKA